jgi:hypothetical protein
MTASTNHLGIPPKSLVLSYRTVFLPGVSVKDTTSPSALIDSPYGKKCSVVQTSFKSFFTGSFSAFQSLNNPLASRTPSLPYRTPRFEATHQGGFYAYNN